MDTLEASLDKTDTNSLTFPEIKIELPRPPKQDIQTKPSTSFSVTWHELRKRSLQPGGFGKERASLWPLLLNVSPQNTTSTEDADRDHDRDLEPHPDEHQIKLDTDRSFVLYPVVNNISDRIQRQDELNKLITSVFRIHPGLSYFQGYHDIITVLFLTLPPPLQLPAAEKLSLHRLRDSMGKTLEPLIGLLRILQRLLRLADSHYASILEQSSPLPYPSLSHLLTLFSHDIPTLPLAQHIFDYLLCRPPIAVVYLAAAVLLEKKIAVEGLVEEGEEGMMHSVLGGLPEMEDGEESETKKVKEEERKPLGPVAKGDSMENIAAGTARRRAHSSSDISDESGFPLPDTTLVDHSADTLAETEGDMTLVASSPLPHPEKKVEPSSPVLPFVSSSEPSQRDEEAETEVPSPPKFGEVSVPSALVTSLSCPSSPTTEIDPANIPLPRSRPPSESRSRSRHSLHPKSSSSNSSTNTQPKLAMISLLEQSDALFNRFPPSHPELHIEETMGPKSVIRTWVEFPLASTAPMSDPSMLGDEQCEAIVKNSTIEDIVVPWDPTLDESEAEPSSGPDSHTDSETDEGEGEGRGAEGEKSWFGLHRPHLRRRRPSKAEPEKATSTSKLKKRKEQGEKEKRPRRKLRKQRRPFFGASRVEFDRRTMLAGAAMVLGVAMAVYATSRTGGAMGGYGGRGGMSVAGLVGVLGEMFGGAGLVEERGFGL